MVRQKSIDELASDPNTVAAVIPVNWRSHASGALFDSGTQDFTVQMVNAPDFVVNLSGAGPPSAGGGVNPGAQYLFPYYAEAGTADPGVVSPFSYLYTDVDSNIYFSKPLIGLAAVDFQTNLGVSGTLDVSGQTTIIDDVDIQGDLGVSGSLTTSGNLVLDNN